MKDQHKHIKGYRDLSEDEIVQMNTIKELGEDLGRMCDVLSKENAVDQRWVSIGRTHLQQGIMALVRAIAKPESF